MKRHLKFTINLFASVLIMFSGTMAAAQADEVWLDFSVPEADVATVKTVSRQASRPQKITENVPSLALNFDVPKVNIAAPTATPITAKVPLKTQPKQIKPKSVKPPKPSPLPLIASTKSQQVTALRRAIIGQESNGKFWLVNPDSGALGYGQLMPENVAPWTKSALGKALTVQDFLNNPELQIKTIDHKLDQYLQRELTYTGGMNEEVAIRRVAAAWYSGNPKFWNDTNPQYSNGRRYPSIENYTRSVWQRYQREIG
jgi:hypothetical protein